VEGGYRRRGLPGTGNFQPQFSTPILLGELHLLAGDAKAAEEWFVKADSVAATPAIRFKLGVLCEATGRLDEAEAHYRSHLAANPDFYVALNQLAWLLARRETKLDEALQLATRANELQPGNAGVLDTLGWIHFKQGRPLDAIPFLQSSLKVHPGDPGTCYHLGAALVAAGRASEAKAVLERSLQISGDGPDSAAVRQLLEKAKP
jgi:tetratricopeptide (TPR) repeat protein